MKNTLKYAIAIGELVSIGETHTVMMGHPQFILTFLYYNEQGDRLTGTTSWAIPVSELPDFKPGKLCALKYKADTPTRVKLMLDKDLASAHVEDAVEKALNHLAVASGQKNLEWLRIRETGIHTKGLVLASKPTGRIVDGCGELTFTLRVTRPDGSSYEVTTLKTLTHEELPNSAVGKVLDVTYDCNDEQNILIAFSG